jgi:propanediol utilization protein
LGIEGVIRESGHLVGTPGVTLLNGSKVCVLDHGVIVAQRHIHMSPQDAERFSVKNGQLVKVRVNGQRPLTFADVVIRVSEKFAADMHLDTDEANACGYFKGMRGEIVSEC